MAAGRPRRRRGVLGYRTGQDSTKLSAVTNFLSWELNLASCNSRTLTREKPKTERMVSDPRDPSCRYSAPTNPNPATCSINRREGGSSFLPAFLRNQTNPPQSDWIGTRAPEQVGSLETARRQPRQKDLSSSAPITRLAPHRRATITTSNRCQQPSSPPHPTPHSNTDLPPSRIKGPRSSPPHTPAARTPGCDSPDHNPSRCTPEK